MSSSERKACRAGSRRRRSNLSERHRSRRDPAMKEDIMDKRDAPEQASPEDEARIGETPAVQVAGSRGARRGAAPPGIPSSGLPEGNAPPSLRTEGCTRSIRTDRNRCKSLSPSRVRQGPLSCRRCRSSDAATVVHPARSERSGGCGSSCLASDPLPPAPRRSARHCP